MDEVPKADPMEEQLLHEYGGIKHKLLDICEMGVPMRRNQHREKRHDEYEDENDDSLTWCKVRREDARGFNVDSALEGMNEHAQERRPELR